MKTFSDIVLSERKTINNMKSIAKKIFSLTNNNWGENMFIKIRYINAIKAEAVATRVKAVFIF